MAALSCEQALVGPLLPHEVIHFSSNLFYCMLETTAALGSCCSYLWWAIKVPSLLLTLNWPSWNIMHRCTTILHCLCPFVGNTQSIHFVSADQKVSEAIQLQSESKGWTFRTLWTTVDRLCILCILNYFWYFRWNRTKRFCVMKKIIKTPSDAVFPLSKSIEFRISICLIKQTAFNQHSNRGCASIVITSSQPWSGSMLCMGWNKWRLCLQVFPQKMC